MSQKWPRSFQSKSKWYKVENKISKKWKALEIKYFKKKIQTPPSKPLKKKKITHTAGIIRNDNVKASLLMNASHPSNGSQGSTQNIKAHIVKEV